MLEKCKVKDEEFQELAKKDERLKDAFIYELANHEYIYANDDDEIRDLFEIEKNERTKEIYKKAVNEYFKNVEA